jgi:hypothetical protein
LKPAPANSSRDPISKKPITKKKKKSGGVAQCVGPKFKPHNHKKKKKSHPRNRTAVFHHVLVHGPKLRGNFLVGKIKFKLQEPSEWVTF